MKYKLKKRYLFPLIFLLILGLSFLIPPLFGVIFILGLPSAILIDSISNSVGGPKDTSYLILIGDLIQFFLIGYGWDHVSQKVSQREELLK